MYSSALFNLDSFLQNQENSVPPSFEETTEAATQKTQISTKQKQRGTTHSL